MKPFISILSLALLACNLQPVMAQLAYTITSPDKNIVVSCNPTAATYKILYKGQLTMQSSRLGVIREDEDFSKNLSYFEASMMA